MDISDALMHTLFLSLYFSCFSLLQTAVQKVCVSCFLVTSVPMATESSGYVWLRAPIGLLHTTCYKTRAEIWLFFIYCIFQWLVKHTCTPKYTISIFLYTCTTQNSLKTSFLTFLTFFWQTDRPMRRDLEAQSPELK